jgi:hypothetical protein
MKRAVLFGWISKNVIFPLIPFVTGVGIRLFLRDPITFSVIVPQELSICMAMLCLLIGTSSTRLSDKHLGDSIFYASLGGIFFYIFFFVLSSVFEELSKGPMADFFVLRMQWLRWLVLLFSGLVVFLAVNSKKRYFPLED